MPRLPSCCPQHSPCSGPSSGHLSMGHTHSGCMQGGATQQSGPPQPGSQHSHAHSHHFHHHHHTAVPSSLAYQESSCPLERPTAMPAPCGGVSSSNQYHDQVPSYQHIFLLFFYPDQLSAGLDLQHSLLTYKASSLNQETRFLKEPSTFIFFEKLISCSGVVILA